MYNCWWYELLLLDMGFSLSNIPLILFLGGRTLAQAQKGGRTLMQAQKGGRTLMQAQKGGRTLMQASKSYTFMSYTFMSYTFMGARTLA